MLLMSLQDKSIGCLPGWQPGSSKYEDDVFPSHFSTEDHNAYAKKYASIPEQFYTKTEFPVVTPSNMQNWPSAWKASKQVVLL